GELDAELADHQLSRPVAPVPGRPVHERGPVLPRRRDRRRRPRDRPALGAGAPAGRRPAARDGVGAAEPPAMTPAETGATPGTSIVYLDAVTVDYDGFKALDRLNFYMDRKELRVVIGPNGAGKTTLLDVIAGRVRPAGGRVIFGHHTDLTTLRENEIVALGVGRKFQTPSVFVNLSVRDNVDLSLRRASKGVLRALFEGGDARDEARRIDDTLARTGLADKAHVIAGALSHGEKQWLEIAMVM